MLGYSSKSRLRFRFTTPIYIYILTAFCFRSLAIKCPSIQYHLAGTKKIQQALAKPGALERFLGESSKIEAVRDVFTGLYSLDFDEAGEQAIQMALDEPEK